MRDLDDAPRALAGRPGRARRAGARQPGPARPRPPTSATCSATRSPTCRSSVFQSRDGWASTTVLLPEAMDRLFGPRPGPLRRAVARPADRAADRRRPRVRDLADRGVRGDRSERAAARGVRVARRDRPLPAARSSGRRHLMVSRAAELAANGSNASVRSVAASEVARAGRPGLGGSPATVRQPSSARRSSVSSAAATIPRACSRATPASGPGRVAPATSAETSEAARAARAAASASSGPRSAARRTSATFPACAAAAASTNGHRTDRSVAVGGSTNPSGWPSKMRPPDRDLGDRPGARRRLVGQPRRQRADDDRVARQPVAAGQGHAEQLERERATGPRRRVRRQAPTTGPARRRAVPGRSGWPSPPAPPGGGRRRGRTAHGRVRRRWRRSRPSRRRR